MTKLCNILMRSISFGKYKIYVESSGQMTTSRHCTVDETEFPARSWASASQNNVYNNSTEEEAIVEIEIFRKEKTKIIRQTEPKIASRKEILFLIHRQLLMFEFKVGDTLDESVTNGVNDGKLLKADLLQI